MTGTRKDRVNARMGAGLRRGLALSLCALLCALCMAAGMSGAWAAEANGEPETVVQASPATYAELLQWRDMIWQETRGQPVRNNPLDTYDPQGKATYLIQLQSYTIESRTPTLDVEDNPILGVTLNDVHAEGPRGSGLGMTLEEVLAGYENQNPALVGDAEFAALYVYDVQERADFPEAAWGLLMRNDAGALSVEYAVSAPFAEADAYTDIIISYVITEGYVTDMRVSDFGDSILSEELRENIETLRGITANTSFDPQEQNLAPLHAEMFQRADLVFSGLDFVVETVEDVRVLLGDPKSEKEVPHEEGGDPKLILTYPGLEFEFGFSADGMRQLQALQITDPNFEGPRGLRVGESLESVLSRFRLEEQGYQEPLTILYAPGESIEQPPFGLLEIYSDLEATVRYALEVPTRGDAPKAGIMLLITVENLRVTELYLYRWQAE